MQRHTFSTNVLLTAALSVAFASPAALAQDTPGQPDDAVVSAFDDETLPEGQGVEVGDTGEISITVADLSVTRVLQLLSMQSQRNIVTSRAVSGNISAALTDVDFYDALDAILVPNGFGYVEKGSFIYVYTADELQELEDASRVPVYEIIELNYISAGDAGAFIEPLLSERGVVTLSAEVASGIDVDSSNAGANSFAHQDTIMVRDFEENLAEIKTVLEQLDVRPPQVRVEATILEAKLTENNAFGVDFAVFTDISLGQTDGPFEALGNLISGESAAGAIDSGAVVQSSGAANQSGGFKVGVTGGDGAVLVRALDTITDTTLLANPQVLVLNRQRANLLVGERLGYITTTRTDVSDSETVEFLEVGTQLSVRPFVSNDGFVRLELSPSISSGSVDTTTGTAIPNETTNTMTTNVIVQSGQTVVLGGLFKENNTVTRSQIPFFGDIPVLGLMGSNRSNTVDRSEVIFMIRPVIMQDEVLYAEGERAEDLAHLAIVGSRDELLPFSRTAMTQDHLKKAYEARDNGDLDGAKWHLDIALYLDPTLVEAIQLRSEITGEALFHMHDSLLHQIVDDMVGDEVGTDIGAAIGDADEATPFDAPAFAFVPFQPVTDASDDFDSTSSTQSTATPNTDTTPEPATEDAEPEANEPAAAPADEPNFGDPTWRPTD